MEDIHRDTFKAEDCKAELAEVTSKLNTSNQLITTLVQFLEYEEAMTVDTRTQQRIRENLEKLGIWPKKNN